MDTDRENWRIYPALMVEQPDMLLNKRYTQLSSHLKARLIILTSSRRSNILDTASTSPVDIVREREERIAATCHFRELAQPFLSFLQREDFRDLFKVLLPVLSLYAGVGNNSAAEHVDRVGLVRSLCTLLPLDVERSLVEPHPPVVSLVAS